ncbi:MAG: ribonuclease R, partial [Candidatus Accumulibacter sp.]|nr:ribonuclease R [Accumulibacter sp.]
NTTQSNAARKQAAKDKAEGKPQKSEKDLTVWDALGVHCSANERRADEASRDVENWLKCFFMQDKIGEEFTGTVAGVTTFGIFVQLDELFVEGLVHITELGADYFQYDEARHELRGERTGQRYQLTDRVTVKVARVDLESRKIDLTLAAPGAQAQAERAPQAKAPSAPAALPSPLERALQAAHEATETKPPKSRKARAKAVAEGLLSAAAPAAAPVPAPAPAIEDEAEEDVVFVPPPRKPRAAKTAATGVAKVPAKAAKKAVAAAPVAEAPAQAPVKAPAKAPAKPAAKKAAAKPVAKTAARSTTKEAAPKAAKTASKTSKTK